MNPLPGKVETNTRRRVAIADCRQKSTLAMLLGLLLLGVACAPRLEPAKPHLGAHEHVVVTHDGWQLGMLHQPPIGRPMKQQAPVILAHGTSCNTRTFDLLERSSMLRDLARAGLDVWAVELRGGPLGARPISEGRVDRRRFSAFRDRGHDWDFDTLVEVDVPAILSRVQRYTGASRVHWIGHSLGGMVAWAAEAKGLIHGFRSLITVGSPAAYGHPVGMARGALGARPFIKLLGGFPARTGGTLAIPLITRTSNTIVHTLASRENMEVPELELVLRTVLEDSPTSLIEQYLLWIRSGQILSRDEKYSYTRHLPDVRSPLFVIAGRADLIAPPWSVFPLYQYASSQEKRYRVFGVAEGDRLDYGHMDLVLGRHAPEEVFPAIRSWLEEH